MENVNLAQIGPSKEPLPTASTKSSVQRADHDLVTPSSTSIVHNLSQYATVVADEGSNGVVIGFDVPTQPASLLDTSVGQVGPLISPQFPLFLSSN